MGIRVLLLWWFFAAWFPEWGLTYWQLILPVFAWRALNGKVENFSRRNRLEQKP